MRAIVCRGWGEVDSLRLEEVASPTPKAGEVLIEVHAAGVNYADSIMVRGQYQTKPPLPFSPGLEVAGIVLESGDGVTRFRPGDRVMAFLNWGGFAEQVVTSASDCFRLPGGTSFEVGGTFLTTYVSSHVAIRWQGRLEPGETMLVLGAAGGVGLTAVEIGKAMGARVVAGASSPDKLEVARAHGADELVDYSRENLRDRVLELTGGKGVDVVYDPVGGDLCDLALSATGWGGRLLHIGFVAGVPQIAANRLLVKHRAAMGSSLRYFRHNRPDLLRKSVEELLGWYADGKLKPLVSDRFPLERTVDAIRVLTGRRAKGKVVVLPGGA